MIIKYKEIIQNNTFSVVRSVPKNKKSLMVVISLRLLAEKDTFKAQI